MILCADAGNTSIKIAMVERGHVHTVVVVASNAPARAIGAAVQRAARGFNMPAGCALASVRPAANRMTVAALRRVCGTAPVIAGPRVPLPIRLAVRHPAALGADRICAAAGAVTARRRHVIVVDIGTAITVDLVTSGVFRGGVILPGPALSLAALHAHTAQLPSLDFTAGPFPPSAVDDTGPAMRWGAGLAAAGGIRAAVSMLERRARRRLPVVVTGGGAGRISALLPARFRFQPHLTLMGLEQIASLSIQENNRHNGR